MLSHSEQQSAARGRGHETKSKLAITLNNITACCTVNCGYVLVHSKIRGIKRNCTSDTQSCTVKPLITLLSPLHKCSLIMSRVSR